MNRGHVDKIVLITGASSGFGKAVTDHLVSKRYRVYGTSRRAQIPTEGDATAYPVMIPMDVCDDMSVKAAVTCILEREGRIDVVVNNAGLGLSGAVEDTSSDEARVQMETNFLGMHRVSRAVLPGMRLQRSGLIINIGSIGGRVAIPFQGFYSASKAAVAMLSEALRMEVAPLGIKVVLVEPGDFRTGFTDNRIITAKSGNASSYRERCETAVAVMEKDERGGSEPADLALLLERIIRAKTPRPRYMIGMNSQKLIARLKSVLPASAFEKIIAAYYRI